MFVILSVSMSVAVGMSDPNDTAPFAVADMAAGKTPVSLLNEICSARGTKANYELVAAEGAVSPVFFKNVIYFLHYSTE